MSSSSAVVDISRRMSALARDFNVAFREAMLAHEPPTAARQVLERILVLGDELNAAAAAAGDIATLVGATVAEARALSAVVAEYEYLLARAGDPEALRRFVERELVEVERELSSTNDLDDETSGSAPATPTMMITAAVGDGDAPRAYLAHVPRRDAEVTA